MCTAMFCDGDVGLVSPSEDVAENTIGNARSRTTKASDENTPGIKPLGIKPLGIKLENQSNNILPSPQANLAWDGPAMPSEAGMSH